MKYLKYFEKKDTNYLFPVDDEYDGNNNFMFDTFGYLRNLNAEPKIFDVPWTSSGKKMFNKDFAIHFKYNYNKEIADFIINRSAKSIDYHLKEFDKLNLIRNELKEKEALQYLINKKYNL
jgi:hypothetical protein